MNYGTSLSGVLVGTAEEVAQTPGVMVGLNPGTDAYFGKVYGRVYKAETSAKSPIAPDIQRIGRIRRRIEDIKQASHLETLWADPWDD